MTGLSKGLDYYNFNSEFEPNLNIIKCCKHHIVLTKFHLSDHNWLLKQPGMAKMNNFLPLCKFLLTTAKSL